MDDDRVRIVRSTRRKRSAAARVVDGVVEVRVPAGLSRRDEARIVERLVARIERRTQSEPIDLTARAAQLAHRYDLPEPDTIRWVDNQVSRWGSCTPATRTIRLSTRLAAFPEWVIDYVIVHELAHLVVHGHGADFWDLVNRYARTERARGYLMAMEVPRSPGWPDERGEGA